jgi:Peptidase family M28
MHKFNGIAVMVLLVAFTWFSIQQAGPPALQQGTVADSSFSTKRAFDQLKMISALPHMHGSANLKTVQHYLVEQCASLGFETRVQSASLVSKNWDGSTIAQMENIVAVKKGSTNSKPVMLMAHYDSEPHTPGAGDDGAAVSAILETMRALSHLAPLQNDLIVLLTDGEELGLLGAQAFVQQDSLAKNIGIVLNFEGRGNSGPSNMFEVNEQNGWAIQEYAKSVAHPFANSLGYEIYKKLPNGTDFTIFKNAGITGLNNAYIDGFVNYHSATDSPENLSRQSLQHHGENMLSLVKHFGNIKITNTKAPDQSYFNIIGGWFVHYPASFNNYFVVAANLLLIWLIFVSIKQKKLRIGEFISGFVLFPLVLVLVYFVSQLALKGIVQAYPLYVRFHENNAYNSSWYALALSLLAIAVFSTAYYFIGKRLSFQPVYFGILAFITILLDGMAAAIPSASYLLYIPLIFLLLFAVSKSNNTWLGLIALLPAICLLAPVLQSTFVAFGLGDKMPFVALGVVMLAGLCLPGFYHGASRLPKALPAIAFAGCIFALGVAHGKSSFNAAHPLQTSIQYELNTDTKKAKWISDDTGTDPFTKQFFTNAIVEKNSWRNRLIAPAPVVELAAPAAVLLKDSTDAANRYLVVNFLPQRTGVVELQIKLSDSVKLSAVHYKNQPLEGETKFIALPGPSMGGTTLQFTLQKTQKFLFELSDRSVGLPSLPGYPSGYPLGYIPSADGRNNETRLVKSFVF